jgi:hypothetical protein
MGLFDFLKPQKEENYFEHLTTINNFRNYNKEQKAHLIGGLITEVADFEYDLVVPLLNENIGKKLSINKDVFLMEQSLFYLINSDIYIFSKLGDKIRNIYMARMEDNYFSQMALRFRNHNNIVDELRHILTQKEEQFVQANSLEKFKYQHIQLTSSKLGLIEYYLHFRVIFDALITSHLGLFNAHMLSKLL